MFLRIATGLAILIAGVLIFAASKPNTFQIRRSIVIQARPETIFPLLNDFHHWSRWAPQDLEDATMKRTYSGPESGIGAASAWSSTDSSGAGRMSITDSLPPTRVVVRTQFERPFAVVNINEFVVKPSDSSTTVTWTMQGTNLYIMKFMSVFINMDRMMGKHFESGLRNLRAVAERNETG